MRPKTNRLLMLLVGAVITGCASQTDRSASGGGTQSQATPEKESVQFVDRPLEESPPPKPKAVVAARKEEPTPDFPVTKYELPEEQVDEEIEELGTLDDESVSAPQQAALAAESSVGETTEYASSDEDEVEDLGTLEDESVSEPQQAALAGESSVGETTEYASLDQEEEIEDLGTQPDNSGTVTYPEEKLAAADKLVGEPTIYADEPAPKATPAAPQKPAPAAPKMITVNFEAEPLFGFDRSEIRGDQRAKLDELVSDLGGTRYDSISVVGHADRIGKTAYNQKLSERRASSVKAYLVKKGIPSDKIQTEGRGESEPVTGDACKKTRGKALISCLQPDRRVDISVSATKKSN
jgi:outer membrane protein OmpA-like peptidoglycan-associated protein